MRRHPLASALPDSALMEAKNRSRMWVELTCADPRVAFRGEWQGPEGPDEIVALAREKAMALGLPVQVEIQRHGVWSIEPTGTVNPGRLFRPEKLPRSGGGRKGR